MSDPVFASRAGLKLDHALRTFKIEPQGWTCADLGSNAGGFVDCLLQRGAAKVYAVERGYGVIDYRLRSDPRVVILERTDARLVRLPELVRLVTIDVGWTRQSQILPTAARLMDAGGDIVTLVKPHYEAEQSSLTSGVLPDEMTEGVLECVREELPRLGLILVAETESPLRGHGGNREVLWHLRRSSGPA